MSEEIELFLHIPGNRPKVISAVLSETLRAVFARHGGEPRDGEHVFVGEAIIALEAPDAPEDDHESVDIDLTILELDLPRYKHIHKHPHRHVDVKVVFNGQSHERRFSPAATVATVLGWSKRRFHVDPSASTNLILELEPEKTYPTLNQHVGELLQPHQHELKFKLVGEITPQG